MSSRRYVCEASELSEGESRLVEVDGRDVGVIRHDGEYYAVQNACCHQGGPVVEGQVREALEAEWPGPGERTVERFEGAPAVACPYHGWEYDLETGVHLGDPEIALETYDVVVEGGSIYVSLRDDE